MDADPPEITGKARVGWGSNRQTHPSRSTGVVGTACRKGEPGNGGGPSRAEVAPPNVVTGGGPARASDRAIVPMRPGNASGGKGPDFWCAFEGAEDW